MFSINWRISFAFWHDRNKGTGEDTKYYGVVFRARPAAMNQPSAVPPAPTLEPSCTLATSRINDDIR